MTHTTPVITPTTKASMTSQPHSQSQPHPAPVLVLGGTGKTGRRVAARLKDHDVPTRIATRGSSPAFDWSDEAGWSAALDGVGSAYLAYSPDLIVPGAVEQVARFAAAARTAGLERLVMLSGRGEEEARAAEDAVRAAGPDLTVVRASWFAQNLTEGEFAPMVAEGVLALPVGAVPEPFVDCDDIADVATAALLQDGHVGEVYEVTGPRSLTFAQLADTYAASTGRPLRHVELTLTEAVAGWRAAGLPEPVEWLLTALFSTVFDGRNRHPGDGVQRALGRPAREVADHFAAQSPIRRQ